MNELCQIIKNMVVPNFINMETSIRTYSPPFIKIEWIIPITHV